MREEENAHPLDDDLFDKLHESHTREMETTCDILLHDIDKMDDKRFALLDKVDIKDIMEVEQKDEDLFRLMAELD